MTRTHGSTATGMLRSVASIRDADIRRAVLAALAPANFDPESLTFANALGMLAVRKEWVREIIRDEIKKLTATTSSGDVLSFEIEEAF